MHFELLINKPYFFNSDDIIFKTFDDKKGITEKDFENENLTFFSKGQPCLRCSPLVKTYGWGIHYNSEGKVAIVAIDSKDYEKFKTDNSLKQVKAMRNKKA